MKCHASALSQKLLRSRPAWGAWIEIEPSVAMDWPVNVAPARGAWIEILMVSLVKPLSVVAPRMGRVD